MQLRPAVMLLIGVQLIGSIMPSIFIDDNRQCLARVNSVVHRRRRFAAPGATWLVEIGVEIPWTNLAMWLRVPILYQLDTLFSSRTLNSSAKQMASRIAREVSSKGRNIDSVSMEQRILKSLRSQTDKTIALKEHAIAEDQLNIFQTLEGAIGDLGLAGRPCMLRAICELQEIRLADWTFVGEILTILMTPKQGDFDYLNEYQQAHKLGTNARNSNGNICQAQYSTCPVSLYNFIPAIVSEDFHMDLGNITNFLI